MNLGKACLFASLSVLTVSCVPLPSTDEDGNQACLHFEDKNVGDLFDVGNAFTTGEVEIRVEQGTWSSSGRLRIDNRGYARGSGRDLNLGNANAHFMLPYPVTSIELVFGELGGDNKISINGTLQEPRDLVELNGTVIDGVSVFVFAVPEGNNWHGTVVLQGAIQDFALGGQELWIDEVCFTGQATSTARSRILFEARSDVDQTYTGFWTDYKADITLRGYTFGHVTTGPVTTALLERWDVLVLRPHRYHYTGDEKVAIQEFVNSGKSVWIVAEFGTPYIFPATQDAMSMFDITHGNNMVTDPTNHELEEFWVVYEQDRNFGTHPILEGIDKIRLDAGATVSGPGYTILVETDDDAVPPRQPMVIAKDHGSGRVLAIADSSFVQFDRYMLHDNDRFALQATEWLLFRR